MAERTEQLHQGELPRGLRERKRARVERELADAALQLFSSKGYDATTVEEVSEVAGVSPRTFFRYYASKEELLFTFPNRDRPLYFISVDGFKAALSDALATKDSVDDLTAVGAALRTLAPEIEGHRERIAMFTAACASSATLRGRKVDATLQLTGWIREAVAQRRGVADATAETISRVAMTLFSLAVDRWLESNGGQDLESCLGDAFGELTLVAAPPSARPTRKRRAIS